MEQQLNTRQMSVSATLLAAALTLLWPIVLGLVGGLAAWMLWGEYKFLGYGVGLGVSVGILASAGVVASSWIVTRVTAPAPVAQPTPQAATVTYAPLGSAQDIRIIPLASYDTLIDRVPARDLVWFVYRIARHGHSLRKHLGKVAPSGQVVDATYWRALCKPLRKAGIIVGVESRRSGTLRTKDTQAILAQLGIDSSDSSLFMFNGATLD